MGLKLINNEINGYLLTKQIGSGGNATVFECKKNNNVYAIKIISGDIEKNKIKRFKKETNFLKESDCEYVIKYIDHGEYEFVNQTTGMRTHLFYLVMPLLDCNFRAVMNNNVIPLNDKIKMLIDACKGLSYAHNKDVIHRDVKPENILVNVKEKRAYLADFGIAHFKNSSNLTKKDDRMANFKYASPEQREIINDEISFASDNYSVGLILNEVFTGHLPLGVDYIKIVDVNQKLFELDNIVFKLIKSNPRERYRDINFAINSIERIINETEHLETEIGNYLSYKGRVKKEVLAIAKSDVAFVYNAIRKSLYLENVSYSFHDSVVYYLTPIFLNTCFVVNRLAMLISNKRGNDRITQDHHKKLTRSKVSQRNKLRTFLSKISILEGFNYIKRDCFDLAYHLTDYHFDEFLELVKKEYELYKHDHLYVPINELYELISNIAKTNDWFTYYNFYSLFGVDYSRSSAVCKNSSFFLQTTKNNEDLLFEKVYKRYGIIISNYIEKNHGDFLVTAPDFDKISLLIEDLKNVQNSESLSSITKVDIDDLVDDLKNYGMYDEINEKSTMITRFGFSLIVRFLFNDNLLY